MLARIRSRLTYANVTATLALFLAVSGGVAWALANNSVRSRHIVNDQVRGIDVREETLGGNDVGPDTITGADVQESSLSGVNADKVDGQDASAFTPAGEVHSPPRFVVNDPTPGDSVFHRVNLMTAGAFTVSAECAEEFGGGFDADAARLELTGPPGYSAAGINGTSPEDSPDPAGSVSLVTLGPTASLAVKSGRLTAVGPGGAVFTVFGSAEVHDGAGDCVFGLTAIGP